MLGYILLQIKLLKLWLQCGVLTPGISKATVVADSEKPGSTV